MVRQTGILFLVLGVILFITGCSSSQKDPEIKPGPADEQEKETNSKERNEKILIMYFFRTGEQYEVGVIDQDNAEIVAEETGTDDF